MKRIAILIIVTVIVLIAPPAMSEEVANPAINSEFQCMLARGKWRAGKCFMEAPASQPKQPAEPPASEPETPAPPVTAEDAPDSPFRDVVIGSEILASRDGLVVLKTPKYFVIMVERLK